MRKKSGVVIQVYLSLRHIRSLFMVIWKSDIEDHFKFNWINYMVSIVYNA